MERICIFGAILFIVPTGWNVRNCLPQQPSGGEIFLPALVSAVVDHQNRELARDIFRIPLTCGQS
jgi:hypothetical protein